MEVNGHCRKCGTDYDAHWTKYPGQEQLRICKPLCPNCGAEGIQNIRVTTDETEDHKRDAYEAKHGRADDEDISDYEYRDLTGEYYRESQGE